MRVGGISISGQRRCEEKQAIKEGRNSSPRNEAAFIGSHHVMNRFIAICGAIWFSFRYMIRLKIAPKEISRFLLKSFNLAICYSGFSIPGAVGQAFQAGKSAFLCCAYDVITDWRRFDCHALDIFKGILLAEARSDTMAIALELYAKDISGHLDEDGLERGSMALRFVTRTIGSEGFFAERVDIDFAGRLWQLVDDLLDYDADLKAGDLNCLTSANRVNYLKRAELLLMEPFASTFLKDRVLAHVTRRAVELARLMAVEV
jgi:hypothetical protein